MSNALNIPNKIIPMPVSNLIPPKNFIADIGQIWNDINKILPNIVQTYGIDDKTYMPYIDKIIEISILGISIAVLGSSRQITNSLSGDESIALLTIVVLTIICIALLLFHLMGFGTEWWVYVPDIIFKPIVFALSFVIWLLSGIKGLLFSLFDFTKQIIMDIFSKPTDSLLKYSGLFAFVAIAFVILYYATFDPAALTTKTYVYMFSIIVPLLFIIGYIYPMAKTADNSPYNLLAIAVIMILFTTIFYSYSSMNLETFSAVAYIINCIIFASIIVGLSMFFYVFSNYLKSLEGWTGFFVYFIFYIPCLLIDFIKYIKREFELTSNVVYILFLFETFLILLYMYVPKLIEYIAYSDGIVLLKDSMFLDSNQIIGNSKQFELATTGVGSTTPIYRQNYALSMWVYLNTEPSNYASYDRETTIFDYGGGKPKIVYYNNTSDDRKKDKYVVYFTNIKSGVQSYDITLPSQTWNYIVFNYSSASVDLFINGNLERTFTFNGDNHPTYAATDTISVGSNDGLNGAICNIHYYTKPLSSSQISNSYNLLMYKNPPVINL